MSRKEWTMFVVGNLLSTATVIADIATLGVCFDEPTTSADDDGTGSAQEKQIELEKQMLTFVMYRLMMFILIFGLVVDVVAALALSIIYESPLGIKSVHNIPFDDNRHCVGSFIMFFVAPFSWTVIYTCGGLASILYIPFSSCEGQGGVGLLVYLGISGSLMGLVGLGILVVTVLTLPFSCGSPTTFTDGCCTSCRRMVHKRILSKGPYIGQFWQLQGLVWSYRVSGLGLPAVVAFGLSGIAGGVLSFLASVAPDAVEALTAPQS